MKRMTYSTTQMTKASSFFSAIIKKFKYKFEEENYWTFSKESITDFFKSEDLILYT